MANMSYCMFENTYRDLKDCYDKLVESGSIEDVKAETNKHDGFFIGELVELCRDIVNEFGDE